MICLDTSILIEYFRKTKKENSTLYKLANEHESFAVSIITKFEIYCGCNSKEQLSFWEQLFLKFRIFPFDEISNEEAVKIYQELKKDNKLIELPDIFIGATAKVHKLKLATNNKKHFKRIKGLELLK